MNKSKKQSDKINVIDRTEFNKIQQQYGIEVVSTKAIKNSKYKKKHNKEFDLFGFIKQKPKKLTPQERLRTKNNRKVLGSSISKLVKRRGKIRAGGLSKKRTRLKKAILRYRQLKRGQTADASNNSLNKQFAVLRLNKNNAIHSRRFRSYCSNCTTPQLATLTDQLLRDLDRFQKRAYQQNEIKARARRRFVIGFRECLNFLHINKAKLVIIAPDCEACTGEAGLDETINNIKMLCQEKHIPCMFSLQRRSLSYVLYKKVPISCVSILDYDGANEIFAQLLLALQDAQLQYKNLIQNANEKCDKSE